MASTGPVWPVVGNGGQLLSIISSLNELVLCKAELRDHGVVYQFIACTAVWDMFGLISSKVAYNGTVFVTVSRDDRLGRYLSLHNHFLAVLGLSVMHDHISIKETLKRESGKKWSIIKQYEPLWRDMSNCGHTWRSITNSDQFSTREPEKATFGLWRHLVADIAYYGIYLSRMTCCRQWWPSMVQNIKFDRVSPLQVRIEGPRSSISGYGM